MAKKLKIDMCAGSELKDTQGETLSVEGADITDLLEGRGRLNDNHGKGFFNSIGRITEAKKIFKAEDCDNERHKYYWEKIKAPYIYAAGELFNDEDHPNAKAAAAILRNIHREDAPLSMKASVEGGVLSRGITDSSRLARTKIHSVALTFTPANNATLVEPLSIDKSDSNWEADKQLIKSVMHLAETNIPSFRHVERHASANTIHDNILKIQELAKTLGIDIEVKQSNPDTIMKQAVIHKITNNIKKINELTKEFQKAVNYNTVMNPAKLAKPVGGNPIRAAADEARTGNIIRVDKFQQQIGQLKSNPTTPAIPATPNVPKMNTTKVQSAEQVASQNVAKLHASKAMRNPAHLDNIHADLVGRGIPAEKAQQVVDHIKTHMVKSLPEDLKDKLIKALTAGYGGSGAPMSFTGGSVIQSESLDDGKRKKIKKKLKNQLIKSFNYITCQECGHEQAHMNHQVKCRECGKNFSLDQLADKL